MRCERGTLRPGGTVVEGTAGNTGIGLAVVGNALGFRTVIVIPRDAEPGEEGRAAPAGRPARRGAGACPTRTPTTTCTTRSGWRRSSGQDRAQRRDLGQPVGQHRQPARPHRDDGRGDLGRYGRQGGRLRLGGRVRRHAGRRLRRPQGQAQGHPDRAGRRARRRALQLLHHRRAEGRGLLHHRGHRPGPHHQEHRGRGGGSRLPDPGCGIGRHLLPASQGGRSVRRRLERRQRRRRHSARQGDGAGSHHRHAALRLRHALPVEAVRPGVSEIEGPAGAALAGGGPAATARRCSSMPTRLEP